MARGDLRPRRARARAGQRPDARRGRLVLADRRPRRPAASATSPRPARSPAWSRESFAGLADRPRQRRDGGPRLVDPARPPRSATTCWPGPTCSAPSPGCPRCPRASSPCPGRGADLRPSCRPSTDGRPATAEASPRRAAAAEPLTPLDSPRPTACPTSSSTSARLVEARPRPSPRARARSPSTPSAPRATATASAPTSCSCAARAPGTWLIDPIACPDLAPARRGDRRRRVDPARRHPGPALPGRGRACARAQLFDTELGGPPARAAPGRARRRGRALPRAAAWPRSTPPSTGRPGRCPSRGCGTPPSTSRCSSSCAT